MSCISISTLLPLRRAADTHSEFALTERGGASQRCRPGRSESHIRIKSDDPNDVRTHCRANQEPVHDAEKGKKQDHIGQEAAPDYEFRVPPEIQERIRAPTVRFPVPLQQIPFRLPAGQLMTLEARREKTHHRAEKQETSPCQIAPIA